MLAVHISDGVLLPGVQLAGFAFTALLLTVAARRLRDDEVPRLGVLTAAFFVASQIHLPVGGVGSAHLLLNGLIAVVLGVRSVVAIAVGLTMQVLLFGHGGWNTLGVNVVVYALPTLAVAPLLRRALASRTLRWPAVRFAVSFAAITLLLATVTVACQWAVCRFARGEPLPTTPAGWWLAWPEIAGGLVVAAGLFAALESRLERDPVYPVGLWLGGGIAFVTVALNVLVLAYGGRDGVRDVAGVVFLANLPVIVVEAVATGFVVAYLHRVRPEWLAGGPR
jgi:ABC-type Co2+ transport system permease subunit